MTAAPPQLPCQACQHGWRVSTTIVTWQSQSCCHGCSVKTAAMTNLTQQPCQHSCSHVNTAAVLTRQQSRHGSRMTRQPCQSWHGSSLDTGAVLTQQPCELAAAFVSTPHDVADKAPRPLGAGSAGPQGKRADAAALVLRCPAIGRALGPTAGSNSAAVARRRAQWRQSVPPGHAGMPPAFVPSRPGRGGPDLVGRCRRAGRKQSPHWHVSVLIQVDDASAAAPGGWHVRVDEGRRWRTSESN